MRGKHEIVCDQDLVNPFFQQVGVLVEENEMKRDRCHFNQGSIVTRNGLHGNHGVEGLFLCERRFPAVAPYDGHRIQPFCDSASQQSRSSHGGMDSLPPPTLEIPGHHVSQTTARCVIQAQHHAHATL